jgi:hypothetical protein
MTILLDTKSKALPFKTRRSVGVGSSKYSPPTAEQAATVFGLVSFSRKNVLLWIMDNMRRNIFQFVE